MFVLDETSETLWQKIHDREQIRRRKDVEYLLNDPLSARVIDEPVVNNRNAKFV